MGDSVCQTVPDYFMRQKSPPLSGGFLPINGLVLRMRLPLVVSLDPCDSFELFKVNTTYLWRLAELPRVPDQPTSNHLWGARFGPGDAAKFTDVPGTRFEVHTADRTEPLCRLLQVLLDDPPTLEGPLSVLGRFAVHPGTT